MRPRSGWSARWRRAGRPSGGWGGRRDSRGCPGRSPGRGVRGSRCRRTCWARSDRRCPGQRGSRSASWCAGRRAIDGHGCHTVQSCDSGVGCAGFDIAGISAGQAGCSNLETDGQPAVNIGMGFVQAQHGIILGVSGVIILYPVPPTPGHTGVGEFVGGHSYQLGPSAPVELKGAAYVICA